MTPTMSHHKVSSSLSVKASVLTLVVMVAGVLFAAPSSAVAQQGTGGEVPILLPPTNGTGDTPSLTNATGGITPPPTNATGGEVPTLLPPTNGTGDTPPPTNATGGITPPPTVGVAAPLTAEIAANPIGGNAPLTVELSAVVAGGTPAYTYK